jgi:hypothetical protein
VDEEKHQLHVNPMAAREKEKKKLEGNDGLL